MANVNARTTTDGKRRYDVRYRLPTGQVRTKTLRTRREAERFAATVEADKARGGLVDPRAGRVTLGDYSAAWLDGRADLRPRTRQLYEDHLRLYISPVLGHLELGRIDTTTLRAWHADLLRNGPGQATAAKSYRLLRTILNTAVADRLILTNPCQIIGAGLEHTPERPTVEPGQVWTLADAVRPERRLLVVLAGFCGLRLGEALGLTADRVDLLHRTIRIDRQLQELRPDSRQVFAEPKTAAGRRTLPLPESVALVVEEHLQRWTGPGPERFLFVGATGRPLRRQRWQLEWDAARKSLGLPNLRFHDLRHSSLTLLAATGATQAELRAAAGHSSNVAAMRYQHATESRARYLADLVDRVITAPQTDLRRAAHFPAGGPNCEAEEQGPHRQQPT
jgi:integrase